MKIKNVSIISVQDFDKLVQETYRKYYSFQQQDGCKSRQTVYITVPDIETNDVERDTIPEVVNGEEEGVNFKAWLERDIKQGLKGDPTIGKEATDEQWRIELWWARNFYPDVQMIVNDLHSKGLLPAGEYGINIDW